MHHKLMMALAHAGAFTVPMSTAYAEGDDRKKPEQSQPIAADDDKKETPKPELIAEGGDKGDSKAELSDQSAPA